MSRLTSWTLAAGAAILLCSTPPGRADNNADGRSIFRFDTFGDEQLWTETLQMEQVIRNVSPRIALAVGLKVDSDALPVVKAIKAGQVNLDDPAVTIQLLKLNAVVGVIGKVVAPNDTLTTIGVTCALCHSTVDDSVTKGIGRRLDGWPNRSLNVGAIIALSPAVPDKQLFQSWGPGKFDARLQMFDGTKLIPLNSPTDPVVIAPAFGLKHVVFETYTVDGVISYWNNYVGVTQMGGHGSFSDARIGVNVVQTPDLVTPKLPALLRYQLSLRTPEPPIGRFDEAAARRGEKIFKGNAECASCHKPPLFTDVLSGPHRSPDAMADPSNASRSCTHPPRWDRSRYMHRAARRRTTARRRYAHFGSTRRISTTAAPPISLPWSITTILCSCLA